MDFPKGSVWYPDGFNEVGMKVDDPNYNPVNNAYTLTNVTKDIPTARKVSSDTEKKYTVGVYDARRFKKPDYSVFVRFPKVGNRPDGYLSINCSDLSSVMSGDNKLDTRFFEGVLKDRETALSQYRYEFNGGGKKSSSRTRTIRKTRKRNFRGRRRTNRRHRRNVKK